MKQLIIFMFALLLAIQSTEAQSAGNTLAVSMANRMKDSLSLSTSQADQVLIINNQLNNEKLLVRQQYTAVDSIRVKIQLIENKRDSLYKEVLTADQFILYRQKKGAIVRAN